MNKAYLVAMREYMENLRTKTFWIGIMIFPVILFLSFAVPYWLEKGKDVRYYAVIDNSKNGLLNDILESMATPDMEKVMTTTVDAYKKYKEGDKKDFEGLDPLLKDNAPEWTEMKDAEKAEFLQIFEILAGPQGEFIKAFLKPLGLKDLKNLKELQESLKKGITPEQKLQITQNLASNPLTATLSVEPDSIIKQGLKYLKYYISFEEFNNWYQKLDEKEAKRFGSNLSKGLYVRKNFDLSGKKPEEKLKEMVNKDELFAYIVIGKDPVGKDPEKTMRNQIVIESNEPEKVDKEKNTEIDVNGEEAKTKKDDENACKYVSKNLTDMDLKNWFGRHLNKVVNEKRIEEVGIDEKTAEWLKKPVVFQEKQISKVGKEEEVNKKDMAKQWAPAGFTYALWISVFMIAQMLLTNTIEEKSNKIMEVLLSSVSPIQLMAGKIVGIASTGLTMVVSWVIFFIIGVKSLPLIFEGMPDWGLGSIISDPIYLGSFVIYFILGYLLLSSILVGIGSVCNSLKEAQNLMGPVTIIMIVPLMALIPISRDPNGTVAQVLSYIPPFTPFVMMNRAAGPPTTMEYVITTALLMVSIMFTLWAAAKIFRIGILMTGKPPKLLEILRWVKAPVGQIPVKKE